MELTAAHVSAFSHWIEVLLEHAGALPAYVADGPHTKGENAKASVDGP